MRGSVSDTHTPTPIDFFFFLPGSAHINHVLPAERQDGPKERDNVLRITYVVVELLII